MLTKAELDRRVAMETGCDIKGTTQTTTWFLQKIVDAIASGEILRLRGFGQFKLTYSNGKMPPHPRFGERTLQEGQCVRYRVHFAKSETLTRAIKEVHHGKVRRKVRK